MQQRSEKFRFDSGSSGSGNVPDFVNLSEFVKHRMEEVVMLTEAVKESPFRGQVFQRLPKHMRRRQMSHFIKRLPRSLQNPYLTSLKEKPAAPAKRPSRKFRRRPNNLLLEYNRRQKKSTWLETHIWHAKRFHMTSKWGYKLPEKPVNKSFKACYRAISEHCLILDCSYYNCVELKGSEEDLLNGLKQCTSTECGLTFAANMYLSGTREGSCTLFHPNSYPNGAIGNVTFMWQPVDGKERKIWIWVHPLFHNEVVDCFSKLFKLISMEAEQPTEICVKNQEEIKLEPKNVPFIRTPKYSNEDNTITMTLLKDTLNRFQLTGPLSQALISQVFSISPIDNKNEEILEPESKKRKLDVKNLNWWEDYYNAEHRKHYESQKQFYEKLSLVSRPEDVPQGMILSLVIEDPRLKLPNKREKAMPKTTDSVQMVSTAVDPSLSQSPIWIPEIRDEVSITKLSTREINEARSKKIVPGCNLSDIIPNDKQSRIPILLVQKPGLSRGKLGFGGGWDIVSPPGFGLAIWFSIIMRGARAGGLREADSLAMERCNSLTGIAEPDSFAGDAQSRLESESLRLGYFRVAPDKRPNYIKLGTSSPFRCPWEVLARDWMLKTGGVEGRFCVLRNKNMLLELAGNPTESPNVESPYLVPVVVECMGRGKPDDFAAICIPKPSDVGDLRAGPVEPPHPDDNERTRKLLKSEHEKLLKSLRRKRKKDRMKLKEDFANDRPNKLPWRDILRTDTAPSKVHVEEYKKRMEELWLPKVSTVADSCSRVVIGYVVRGGFSFLRSTGLGLGYVTLAGLVELMNVCRGSRSEVVALFRNRNEAQYKFAKLSVTTD